MRIVHVCRVAPPSVGGMERMLDGLTARQLEAGHDVRIVTTWTGHRDVWATDAGVAVHHVPRVGARRYPFARGLGAHLQGADVIHVHGVDGLADQVLSQRPAGVRVGVSTHGGYLHTRRQWWLKQAWLRTVTPLSLGRADAVWFTSAADQEALAPARLAGEVVGNGLDLGEALDVAQHRDLEPGRWVVLGRVDRHKGLVDIVRTLGAVARLDPRPFHLHVVGEVVHGATAARAQAEAAAQGIGQRLTLHGAVDDAVWWRQLQRAELALFGARHEGFGLALVEAMAAGVAPMVQDGPAHRAHVASGDTGWVVDFGRPEQAARTLIAARAQRLEAVGNVASQSARAWDWSHMYPRWDAAYARLLGAA